MLKKFVLATVALSSLAAFASDDTILVKSLLPEGQDIAQVALARGNSSAQELEELAKSNYIITDINKDGVKDILVIAEEAATYRNYNTDLPCQEGTDDCMTIHGERYLNLYLGKNDGSFELNFSNSNIPFTADEGGQMGDPLGGLELRANGSITISHFGGSAWKWSYKDTFQFRQGDFYVIGQDSAGNNPMMGGDTKSIDLLTGQVVETTQKNGDSPVKTKRYKIKVKPLVRVADYKGQQE
ncbi:MAG: hypothetical protein ACJ76H_12180 [Bacteriovoracaceae bacterium]